MISKSMARTFKWIAAATVLSFLAYQVKEQAWPTPEIFSVEKAKERVRHHTRGCSEGGSPRGVSVSSWPGEFATWMEFSLTDEEVACLKGKGIFGGMTAGCEMVDFLGTPPEWFQASGAGFFLQPLEGGHGFCVWRSKLGSNLYVANRNSVR